MNKQTPSSKQLLLLGTLCIVLAVGFSFKEKIYPHVKQSVQEEQSLSAKNLQKGLEGAEPKVSQEDKIPHRKVYTELQEKDSKVIIQFQDQRDELIREMPLVTDLQRLEDGQAHHITPGLLETGKRISRLKQLVLSYPELKPLQNEANQFYESCAGDDDFPTSIRSLCLFSRLQLAKNRKEKFDIAPYPLEIKQMVMELAPFKN